MTLNQIYNASQILAAIAVVASLIFVGLQLRQSDRTQRANSLQSVLDGYRDRTFLPGINSGEVMSIWARGLTSLNLLDANDKRRFWFILLNEFLPQSGARRRFARPAGDWEARKGAQLEKARITLDALASAGAHLS